MKNQRREKIKQLVDFYKKHQPYEYAVAIRRAKKVRDSKANIFGSDIKKEFRHEFSLPSKLYDMIDESLETPFLKDNSEASWFRRTFPEFGGSIKW